MTQTKVLPVRARARVLALVVPLLVALGLTQACAENRRPFGEACLKSADCISGTCLQLVCSVPGPTTNVEETAEAAASDAETTADTGEPAADTGTPATDSGAGGDAIVEAASGGE